MACCLPPQPLACGPWCAALPSAFYRALGCDWGVSGGQPARPRLPKGLHSYIWCPSRHFCRGGGVIGHQPALPGLYDYLSSSQRLANRRPAPGQLTWQTWHAWGGISPQLPICAWSSLSIWPTAAAEYLANRCDCCHRKDKAALSAGKTGRSLAAGRLGVRVRAPSCGRHCASVSAGVSAGERVRRPRRPGAPALGGE